MKKIIWIICCMLGIIIACVGILFGIFLVGDYISNMYTVDMEPFKEKYTRYADVITAYDDEIIVDGTNGNYTEGSCWQCYNFDLNGLCYNFLFECNVYGDESFKIELSKIPLGMPTLNELTLFITMCEDISEKDFSKVLLREKCEEALRTGRGRISKEYYFEVDESGTLSFCCCPK